MNLDKFRLYLLQINPSDKGEFDISKTYDLDTLLMGQ